MTINKSGISLIGKMTCSTRDCGNTGLVEVDLDLDNSYSFDAPEGEKELVISPKDVPEEWDRVYTPRGAMIGICPDCIKDKTWRTGHG